MRVAPQTPARTRSSPMLARLAWAAGCVALLGPVSPADAGGAGVSARVGGSARVDGGALAHTARSLYLVESAKLRMVRGNEASISERGSAAGTFNAALNAQLTISAERVSAVFTIYPRGGSITGRASARFVVRGHTGYYGGALTIVHGTGAYRHASGTNIGISGTIDRLSFALTVKAHGWMRL